MGHVDVMVDRFEQGEQGEDDHDGGSHRGLFLK
jgi:hypothetical protein